jgi:hypothetical protein
MTISTVFPALNAVLTLQGARNTDGSISGTWTLTGQSGCIGDSARAVMGTLRYSWLATAFCVLCIVFSSTTVAAPPSLSSAWLGV